MINWCDYQKLCIFNQQNDEDLHDKKVFHLKSCLEDMFYELTLQGVVILLPPHQQ